MLLGYRKASGGRREKDVMWLCRRNGERSDAHLSHECSRRKILPKARFDNMSACQKMVCESFVRVTACPTHEHMLWM